MCLKFLSSVTRDQGEVKKLNFSDVMLLHFLVNKNTSR